MMLRKCRECGRYTMAEECCGRQTSAGHPPKFNMHDRYARYRRREKGLE